MATSSFVLRKGLVSLPSIIFLLFLCRWQLLAFVPSASRHRTTTTVRRIRQLYVSNDSAIPFVIERLPDNVINQKVFREISDVCIEAFFNDGGNAVPPWTQFQLASLRSLQQADLKFRRRRDPTSNMMFVARRVSPASATSARKTPLLLDLKQVYNLVPEPNQDYVRGEILGFVEVTKKPYGLGPDEKKTQMQRLRRNEVVEKRPILTNLSVQYQARKSGVGSKLVELCERRVMNEWNMYEIILEVEEDNENAQKFYKKRGYNVIFEDPTSRRYDVSGLWLSQKRCKRKIMRKTLDPFQPRASKSVVDNLFGVKILQRLRESVFSTPTARL